MYGVGKNRVDRNKMGKFLKLSSINKHIWTLKSVGGSSLIGTYNEMQIFYTTDHIADNYAWIIK